ncbi:winged helix-turn-helix domain-containing protein [Candidatus Mycoplasma pogonae]
MQEKINKVEEIINYLINLIESKKVKTNQILPSENFLIEKFGSSRITVISAYKKLEQLGYVYTVPKKGRFVAENLCNIIEPISAKINSENSKIQKVDLAEPDWFAKHKIIFTYGYDSYIKKYFKQNTLIMHAEYFVSKKYSLPEVAAETNIIEFFLKRKVLKNTVYHLQYEKTNFWPEYQKLVVVYLYGYDDEGICIAGRYWIHPDDFYFTHQEFSLN